MRETENTEENVFSGIGRGITWIYFGWKWEVLFGRISESEKLKAHLCTVVLCTQGPGETGCTQTPYWGHPLCGHKASFSSLSGRHSSCQPAVGMSFRAEDWWCELGPESWSTLGWDRGLLTPPSAPPAEGLEQSLCPGEGSGEWWCHRRPVPGSYSPPELSACSVPLVLWMSQQEPAVAHRHLWGIFGIPDMPLSKPCRTTVKMLVAE